jgi:predicted Zn-dependent protease
MKKSLLVVVVAIALATSGCANMNQSLQNAASIAGVSGYLPVPIDSITKSVSAVTKATETLTPIEEYYIGRTVGAEIVGRYPVKENVIANNFLNILGQSLVNVSDKPTTFKGYHFLMLDTNEVVAYSAPSGFIFISKGMIKLCKNEDDLAAVLAHEIGHIQHSHAIEAISTSRWTSAATTIASEATKSVVGGVSGAVFQAFDGTINDITQTLINTGYARGQESEADAAAIQILQKIGYNPTALVRVLENMKATVPAGSGGFMSTHPAPDDRIADIRPLLPTNAISMTPNVNRDKRFKTFLNAL